MCALMLVACSGNASNKEKAEESRGVNAEGMILEDNEKEEVIEEALPFSGDEVREHVVLDYGNRTVRSDADESISMKHLILFILALLPATILAQVDVEARIDSLEMMIGEQVHVTVTATVPQQSKVNMPTFQPRENIVPGVEVLAVSDEQTEDVSDGRMQVKRIYTLTSFDGKLYYLPAFRVKVNGKVYPTKSLALKVIEVEVDTTKLDKFYGPKDVQDNPFSWAEWALPFWLSILSLLLMAVAYYLYLRLRDNKPIIKTLRIVKRLLPHQKAMKEIEQIKAERMVSSENPKEYYTKLTDTLRKYIEERYHFSAMEMTSGEIIERLTSSGDQAMIDELRQLFITADLVKFAKYSTLINENDANLVNAIAFIDQTKPEAVATEEVQKPELTEADQRSLKTRRLLKTVISLIVVACVAMLVYAVYHVLLLGEWI